MNATKAKPANLLAECAKTGAALKVRKLSETSMEFALALQGVVETQSELEPMKRGATVLHLKRLHDHIGAAIKSLGDRR